MTTFKFTVRAEDDQGAFADREFSIKVRNTLVDRYMVVNNEHAWTSVDMQTWTQRNNQSGIDARYGGGNWLVWITGNRYRLSPDGINFTEYTAGTGTWSHVPVWFNNRWNVVDTVKRFFTSVDGLSWTQISTLPSAVNTSLNFKPAMFGTTIVYQIAGTAANIMVSQDSGLTWSTVATGLPHVLAGVQYINGLWVFATHYNTTDRPVRLWYSPNLANFYEGNYPNIDRNHYPDEIHYINGKIAISFRSVNYTGYGNDILMSSNAKDWTQTNIGSYLFYNPNHVSRLIFTKGNIYMTGSNPTASALRVSTDLGATWTNQTVPFTYANSIAMIR